jgi:hypothetical protein
MKLVWASDEAMPETGGEVSLRYGEQKAHMCPCKMSTIFIIPAV